MHLFLFVLDAVVCFLALTYVVKTASSPCTENQVRRLNRAFWLSVVGFLLPDAATCSILRLFWSCV